MIGDREQFMLSIRGNEIWGFCQCLVNLHSMHFNKDHKDLIFIAIVCWLYNKFQSQLSWLTCVCVTSFILLVVFKMSFLVIIIFV